MARLSQYQEELDGIGYQPFFEPPEPELPMGGAESTKGQGAPQETPQQPQMASSGYITPARPEDVYQDAQPPQQAQQTSYSLYPAAQASPAPQQTLEGGGGGGFTYDQLAQMAREAGVTPDDSDIAVLTSGRLTGDAALQWYQQQLAERAAPTASAGGTGGSDDTNGDGIRDVLQSGNTPNRTGDGGAAVTSSQLAQLLAALQAMMGGTTPTVDGSVPELPVINVPGEDLSPGIDDAILRLLDQEDPLDALIRQTISERLDPANRASLLDTRLNAIREESERMRRGLVGDTDAELASRGLLRGGGERANSLDLINQHLAEVFGPQAQNAMADEFARQDATDLANLQMATGFSRDQAASLLAGIGAGNDRQQMLSQIALAQLNANIEWNEFLATHGLDRERLMYEIQAGRQQAVVQIMTAFLSYLAQIRGGFVGSDTSPE